MLKYIGAMMLGGTIAIIFHCMLIVAKESDENTFLKEKEKDIK